MFLGLSTSCPLFSICPGCTLVVLAALRATASIPQPFICIKPWSNTPLDDFDLLIGVTSITHSLTMVTNNTDHFKRINGINLEDWTK